MLFNDKLMDLLNGIIKNLESRKEPIPSVLTQLLDYCNTRVKSNAYNPKEFQRHFDECRKKLIDMASGGYLYFKHPDESKKFFDRITNFAVIIINSKRLSENYNNVVIGKLSPEEFFKIHKATYVRAANIEQRQKDPKAPIVFETGGDGLYMAISLRGNVYAFVPRFGLQFEDFHYDPYGMSRVFYTIDFKRGFIFNTVLVVFVALFEFDKSRAWRFLESGRIKLKDVPRIIQQPTLTQLATQVKLLAHGGTGFWMRRRIGNWPDITTGTLEDDYALPQDTINFGVGELENQRFIIIRQRQHVENRGGYAYTLLLDPGEPIWQKAKWNAALIIQKILSDKELMPLLMEDPEHIAPDYLVSSMLKLWHSDWNVAPARDAFVQKTWAEAERSSSIVLIGLGDMLKPTPEKFAQALASLPETINRKVTWLIGGGKNWHYLGCRIVWDPEAGVGFYAYGGTSYSIRRSDGDFPKIDNGILQSFEGFEGDKIIFGVGEKEGRRFIILRQHQLRNERGGYPYNAFLDPGKAIWEKAKWNAALIVRNILNNSQLRYWLLEKPEEAWLPNLIPILSNTDWKVTPSPDAKVQAIWKRAESSKSVIIIGPSEMEMPTPDKLAQALASLPPELNRKVAWIIGSNEYYANYFGSRIVWKPSLITPTKISPKHQDSSLSIREIARHSKNYQVIGYSAHGLSHSKRNAPNQDSILAMAGKGGFGPPIILAVSDGVSIAAKKRDWIEICG